MGCGNEDVEGVAGPSGLDGEGGMSLAGAGGVWGGDGMPGLDDEWRIGCTGR